MLVLIKDFSKSRWNTNIEINEHLLWTGLGPMVLKLSFVLVFGGGGKKVGPLDAKVLLVLRLGVGGSYENQKDAYLLYMVVTRPIDMVGETLGCIFQR